MDENPPLSDAGKQVLRLSVEKAREYLRTTNEIIGVLAFTCAIASIDTENPRFFAMVSAIVIFLAWLQSILGYRKRVKMLRVIGLKDLRPLAFLRRTFLAVTGWVILGVVAGGFVDKYGINLSPDVPFCLRSLPLADPLAAPQCTRLRY